MIRGIVNSLYEAVVRISVRGPQGDELEIDAIVDTGFTSSLTLPIETVESLDLVRRSGGTALLADGSVLTFEIFDAELKWSDHWRHAVVSGVGQEPLIGMGALAGNKLAVEVTPGGSVEIRPLGQ